ncbi:MAG: amidohydrolase [Candidatus Odinarchaeota archaeon]
MTLVITGCSALTMAEKPFIKNATIIIEGAEISEIGPANEVTIPSGADTIRLGNYHVMIPALINSHTHASMTLLRGYADDLPVVEWLNTKIFPLEAQLKPDDIYLGTKLACVESMLGGTTCMNSMYHMMQNEARAIAEAGIRGVVGHVCFDWRKDHDIKETTALASKWHGKADGRVRISVDPHATYTVSPDYWIELKELTEDLNRRYGQNGTIAIHTHLAETGFEEGTTIEYLKSKDIDPNGYNLSKESGIFAYLDEMGFFNSSVETCPHVTAAHSVALRKADFAVITKYQGKIAVAHCPVSNLKLGSGIAPLPELMARNVPVGLGTDGCASNNTLDMIETMKLTALIHKGIAKRADIVKAEEALKMATTGRAIHWEDLGELRAGFLADIAVLNLKKPHLLPVHDIMGHIVYSAGRSDVEHVICNGELVVENGIPLKVNTQELFEQIEDTKEDILSRIS